MCGLRVRCGCWSDADTIIYKNTADADRMQKWSLPMRIGCGQSNCYPRRALLARRARAAHVTTFQHFPWCLATRWKVHWSKKSTLFTTKGSRQTLLANIFWVRKLVPSLRGYRPNLSCNCVSTGPLGSLIDTTDKKNVAHPTHLLESMLSEALSSFVRSPLSPICMMHVMHPLTTSMQSRCISIIYLVH